MHAHAACHPAVSDARAPCGIDAPLTGRTVVGHRSQAPLDLDSQVPLDLDAHVPVVLDAQVPLDLDADAIPSDCKAERARARWQRQLAKATALSRRVQAAAAPPQHAAVAAAAPPGHAPMCAMAAAAAVSPTLVPASAAALTEAPPAGAAACAAVHTPAGVAAAAPAAAGGPHPKKKKKKKKLKIAWHATAVRWAQEEFEACLADEADSAMLVADADSPAARQAAAAQHAEAQAAATAAAGRLRAAEEAAAARNGSGGTPPPTPPAAADARGWSGEVQAAVAAHEAQRESPAGEDATPVSSREAAAREGAAVPGATSADLLHAICSMSAPAEASDGQLAVSPVQVKLEPDAAPAPVGGVAAAIEPPHALAGEVETAAGGQTAAVTHSARAPGSAADALRGASPPWGTPEPRHSAPVSGDVPEARHDAVAAADHDALAASDVAGAPRGTVAAADTLAARRGTPRLKTEAVEPDASLLVPDCVLEVGGAPPPAQRAPLLCSTAAACPTSAQAAAPYSEDRAQAAACYSEDRGRPGASETNLSNSGHARHLARWPERRGRPAETALATAGYEHSAAEDAQHVYPRQLPSPSCRTLRAAAACACLGRWLLMRQHLLAMMTRHLLSMMALT